MASPKNKNKYYHYVKKQKPLEPYNEKTKKSEYNPKWEQLPDFKGEWLIFIDLLYLEFCVELVRRSEGALYALE